MVRVKDSWPLLLCGFSLLSLLSLSSCSFPEPAPHPRLFLLDQDLPLIHDAIQNDSVSAYWYNSLLGTANSLLNDTKTVVWTPGRITTQSRTVLARVSVLAGIYRLTGNVSYADRAILEMMAAAGFPYWEQQAFLDTSEMTTALAIGYDWLYDVLTDADKQVIENAIYTKGFHFGMEMYNGNWTKDPLMQGNFNWATCNMNWNLVCNGGLSVGAIALWEVFLDVTEEILQYALKGMPYAIESYAPDGGWIEGPVYWNYATRYFSYAIAASLSAFGTEFGLLTNFSFMSLTGDYRIHALSTGYIWDNYADAVANMEEYSWAMMFLGRYYDNPLYIAHERRVTTAPQVDSIELPLNILHLFFSRAEDSKYNFPFSPPPPPMEAYFRHIEVVSFRTSWDLGTKGPYLYGAIKGGDTTLTHQDLDLGHFIVEKNGHRFALDLGPDNYSLPDYFTIPERYQYYRTNTSGHNTLTFNGDWNQQITKATVSEYTVTNESIFAAIDLTAAYAPNATTVTRQLLFDRSSDIITITDMIEPNANTSTVTWRFHSQMSVTSSGDKAMLSFFGTDMEAIIISPNTSSWDTYLYTFERPYYLAPHLTVLQFTLNVTEPTEIVVQFI